MTIDTRWLALLLVSVACNGAPERRYCDRLDECGALESSIDQCESDFEEVIGALPDDDRDTCDDQLEACLDLDECGNFEGCSIDSCGAILLPPSR